jgi:hypothetical protein
MYIIPYSPRQIWCKAIASLRFFHNGQWFMDEHTIRQCFEPVQDLGFAYTYGIISAPSADLLRKKLNTVLGSKSALPGLPFKWFPPIDSIPIPSKYPRSRLYLIELTKVYNHECFHD